MNWDMETNYICPSAVHHSTTNNYVHLADCVLQTSPSNVGLQHSSTTKLNDEQQLVRDELRQDSMIPTVQQQQHPQNNLIGSGKQNFSNVDLNGSKVIRLVRAKQATKRKSSLDTLIEVVQKELLRVNGQSTSTSPSSSPPHYSQTRSTPTTSTSFKSRPMVSSIVLPSSHPASLTSQSNHSYKIARRRVQHHAKRLPTTRHRTQSFNNDELINDMDYSIDEDPPKINDQQQSIEDQQASIEDIVRDTVDKLVAITLLNNAPFIVNMLTALPGNTTGINTESKPSINTSTSIVKSVSTSSSEYYRNDLALLSSTASDIRNSMQQASPIKQPGNPSTFVAPDSGKSPSTSTVFVAPRLLNFQTVVPKPTTNIQIGNTKIILVSPSTTSLPQPQSSCLMNSNPIKLVKFTPSPSSTLTLPKNVQIVLPSRTSNDSLAATYRPLTKLTTCSIDQIPQAAQEVTITTSPPLNQTLTINKPRRRSSTSTPIDKPVGKVLRPIAKVLPVYSPNNSNHTANPLSTITTNPTHDDISQPMPVNFPQQLPRSSSAHGPMIYRMTSVNPNVPVFRVRATTTPTSSTIKPETKSISMTTTTGLSYEPKQMHNTTTGGSVSVLACFKTTKKRNKERAIMPRPSITDVIDTSHDIQQRLTTPTPAINMPLMINSHTNTSDLAINNTNSSSDHRQQSNAIPVRLIHSSCLPTTHIEQKTSYIQHGNDSVSSATKIFIPHTNSPRFAQHSVSMKALATPLVPSICSLRTARPLMEDKGIQCIDDEEEFEPNSINPDEQQILTNASPMKRTNQSCDESWTMAADTLLRNVLSQYGFRFLDVHCQQNLSSKFDTIQANLVSGMIPTRDEFYKTVVEIKENLLDEGLSKISADNLEKLFHYFEVEYPKICDGDGLFRRTNDRKRARRQ